MLATKRSNLAEYWAGIDAEDETDPWHGELEEDEVPRVVTDMKWGWSL